MGIKETFWPYIPVFVWFQGPCTGNQQSLAHSRLWDAVVGFLHVFAHMQMKLSQVNIYSEVLEIHHDLDTQNPCLSALVLFLLRCCLDAAGFKSNRAAEGAHGSSEGYGRDALVHAGR